MKKIFLLAAFCLFLLPAVAFCSPTDTTPPVDATAVQVSQAPDADPNSIAGMKDPDLVPMQRGCCSHHGGVAYCDEERGRYVCNDGTYSPTCRC